MMSLRSPRSIHNLQYPHPDSPSEYYYRVPVPGSPSRYPSMSAERLPVQRFSMDQLPLERRLSAARILHYGTPPLLPLLERRFSHDSVSRHFGSGGVQSRRAKSVGPLPPPPIQHLPCSYYMMPTVSGESPRDRMSPSGFRHEPISGSPAMADIGFTPRRYPSDVQLVENVDDDFVGPLVTSFGIICLFLEKRIRVDLTMDNSIRVVNGTANCKAAINGRGDTSCLVHPFGSVHQTGSQVQVQTSGQRRAKLTARGITFSARDSPVAYLLDAGGVKTTVDNFNDLLSFDHSLSVFYGEGAHCGQMEHVNAGLDILRSSSGSYRTKTEQTWIINGVRVGQGYATGDVTVVRDQGRRSIKTSPSRGTISVTTPYLYACASLPPDAHVFCRRGERRVHGSDAFFSVRNGSQSAGYDDSGRLRIF